MTRARLILALLLSQPAGAALVCSLDAVTQVSFGAYDPFAVGPTDGVGSLTYSCSGAQASDVIAIEISAGGASDFTPRALSAGIDQLNYNLFLDAARARIWGDSSGGSERYTASGVGLDGSHPVSIYGRIPAGQNPPAGSYGDDLLITLVY